MGKGRGRLGLVLALAGLDGAPASPGAATIPVNVNSDTVANDTNCSLREAVNAAMGNATTPWTDASTARATRST